MKEGVESHEGNRDTGSPSRHAMDRGETLPKNVLIVDDEMEMLLVMQKALEPYKEVFSVLVAGNGEEALDLLKEVDVSLVVTDLIMPRMDGFTLLVHIRSDFPDIPVIIMTAHNRPVMERMAWKIGVAEYIEKPFDIEDLADKITSNLGDEDQAEKKGLRDMNVALFLQLIEVERKSCEIHLIDVSSRREGVLFFLNGDLTGARLEDLPPEKAARDMLSWRDVEISIQEGASVSPGNTGLSLQSILSSL